MGWKVLGARLRLKFGKNRSWDDTFGGLDGRSFLSIANTQGGEFSTPLGCSLGRSRGSHDESHGLDG
jgi:hypothetical protein